MTYEYEGKTWELVFAHRTKMMHDRLMEPREGCELYIREAGKDTPKKIRWGSVALLNPKDPYQREMGRQKAINNLYRDTDMGWEEYVLVRKAYFLRKRKTKEMKRQTKAFNRELRRLITSGDTHPSIRSLANQLHLCMTTFHGTPEKLHV